MTPSRLAAVSGFAQLFSTAFSALSLSLPLTSVLVARLTRMVCASVRFGASLPSASLASAPRFFVFLPSRVKSSNAALDRGLADRRVRRTARTPQPRHRARRCVRWRAGRAAARGRGDRESRLRSCAMPLERGDAFGRQRVVRAEHSFDGGEPGRRVVAACGEHQLDEAGELTFVRYIRCTSHRASSPLRGIELRA